MSLADYLTGRPPATRANGEWRLQYRDASVKGNETPSIPWGVVATAGREKTLRDEVLAPTFPWRAGDLLVLRSPQGAERDLWVGTEHGFRSAGKLPSKLGRGRWLDAWEGPEVWARTLLGRTELVDSRRVALAACACARAVLFLLNREDQTTGGLLDLVEAWARREVTIEVFRERLPQYIQRVERVGARGILNGADWWSMEEQAALAARAAARIVTIPTGKLVAALAYQTSYSATRAIDLSGRDITAHEEAMAREVLNFIPLPVFLLAHLGEPAPSYLQL